MDSRPEHLQLPFIAYDGDEPYVFVSYAHKDAEVVYDELKHLKDLGYNIWYDEGISPGHGWQSDLAHSIEESSLFLLYVSDACLDSPNCRRETNFALEKEIPFLAIHLAEVTLSSEWQFAIGDRQAILRDRYDKSSYQQKLLHSIDSLMSDKRVQSARAEEEGTTEQVSLASMEPSVSPDVVGEGPTTEATGTAASTPKRMAIAAVVGALVASGIGYVYYERVQEEHWVTQEMLPQIASLIDQDQYGAAYRLAKAVEARGGRDRIGEEIWKTAAANVNVELKPEGTDVYYRSYDQPQEDWHYLGKTPLTAVELPRDMLVIRLEKEGFDSSTRVMRSPGMELPEVDRPLIRWPLDLEYLSKAGETPVGMVYVPATNFPVFYRFPPTDLRKIHNIPDYFMDRFEVTNEDYQGFVDAGGYQKGEYWQHLAFSRDDQPLGWQDAVAELVDGTGEPGPAGWEFGAYPQGRQNYPVNGISWWEASAYARYKNKRLPTALHWARAAILFIEIREQIQPLIVQQSNFSDALAPVGAHTGLSSSGASDMAGNVREWVSTGKDDQKLILGAAYTEPPYLFSQPITADPWDRSLKNGMRLMTPIAAIPDELLAPLPPSAPADPSLYVPVTDEIFNSMLAAYRFPPFVPDAREDEVIEGETYWNSQRVSLRSGTGDDRFDIHIYFPKKPSSSYQGVVFLPGSSSYTQSNFQVNRFAIDAVFQPHLRRGRAAIWPIWYGTFERYDGYNALLPDERNTAMLERLRRWHKEVYSTLNYLELRGDFETGNFGYAGLSYGALYPVPLLYLEPRFKAAILLSGGITANPIPVASAFQFVIRTTTPTLMLNGKHDYLIPLRMAQGMYDSLATEAENKRFVSYDAGHWPLPRNQTIREINSWFDTYLGPVK